MGAAGVACRHTEACHRGVAVGGERTEAKVAAPCSARRWRPAVAPRPGRGLQLGDGADVRRRAIGAAAVEGLEVRGSGPGLNRRHCSVLAAAVAAAAAFPRRPCRSAGGAAAAAAGFCRRQIEARRPDADPRSTDLLDLFGSQIQGDLIGAAQWRIYHGAAKEFGFAAYGSSP